MTWVALNYLTF